MTNGHTLVIRFGLPGCSFLTDGRLGGLAPCGKEEAKIYIEEKDRRYPEEARPFGLCDQHLIDPETMPSYFREFDEKNGKDQAVMMKERARG